MLIAGAAVADFRGTLLVSASVCEENMTAAKLQASAATTHGRVRLLGDANRARAQKSGAKRRAPPEGTDMAEDLGSDPAL